MGYFKIELIHEDGIKYYTEWDIEECFDYSEDEYINLMTGYSVADMEIDIFDMQGNEITRNMSYEEYEDFKKYLEWGKVIEVEIPHY